jgi:hypothetical protein
MRGTRRATWKKSGDEQNELVHRDWCGDDNDEQYHLEVAQSIREREDKS